LGVDQGGVFAQAGSEFLGGDGLIQIPVQRGGGADGVGQGEKGLLAAVVGSVFIGRSPEQALFKRRSGVMKLAQLVEDLFGLGLIVGGHDLAGAGTAVLIGICAGSPFGAVGLWSGVRIRRGTCGVIRGYGSVGLGRGGRNAVRRDL